MPECVKMHKFSVSHPNTFKYTQTSSWRVSVYIPNIFQWYSNFPMIKPNTSPQRIGSCQSSSFFGRRSSLGPGCCSVKMKASALSWCQMMPVSPQCYWILLGCEWTTGTGIFAELTVQPRWIFASVETHLILQFSRPNCLRNGSKSPCAERTIGHRSSSGMKWEKHSANEAFNIFQSSTAWTFSDF